MSWLFLVIGLFIGAFIAVAIMACIVVINGNPPTNWRGEEPYDKWRMAEQFE